MKHNIFFSVAALLALTSSVFAQDASEQRLNGWFAKQDPNGDGRIARTEASGLMKRFFDRNDANRSGHGVFVRNAKETGPMMEAFFARTLKASTARVVE